MAYFALRFVLKYHAESARRRLCDELERLGGVEAADLFYMIELDGTAAEVRDYFRTILGFSSSPYAGSDDKQVADLAGETLGLREPSRHWGIMPV